jgi:hypothetical protein
MTLGGKMYNAIYLMLYDYASHLVKIGDIGLDKCIVGAILYILEIGEVTGIGEFVKVYDVIIGIFVDKKSHNM